MSAQQSPPRKHLRRDPHVEHAVMRALQAAREARKTIQSAPFHDIVDSVSALRRGVRTGSLVIH